MAARSGGTGEKKPSRIPVTGLNLVEALSDAGIFIASQGFVGALRMLFQGTLADAARKVFSKPEDTYKSDEFDNLLAIVRKHVADVYPAPDRPKVQAAVQSYLLKAVDLYGNGSLSPEARRLSLESLKNALGQDLRSIQDSHTTFQTRVFEMLDSSAQVAAMAWLSTLDDAQKARWTKIQELIESPMAFTCALAAAGLPDVADGGTKWRESVLRSLEILTAKPEQPKGKNLLEQLAELSTNQTFAKIFEGPKPVPPRVMKMDFSIGPSGAERPETDEEYKDRLVGEGVMKANENLRDILLRDARERRKRETLSNIDAEDDAMARLVRGEFKR